MKNFHKSTHSKENYYAKDKGWPGGAGQIDKPCAGANLTSGHSIPC